MRDAPHEAPSRPPCHDRARRGRARSPGGRAATSASSGRRPMPTLSAPAGCGSTRHRARHVNDADFRLLWQEKLPVTAAAGPTCVAGVTANGMQVFTPTSFVTGVSNVVFALDNDTGHPNFVKQFDATLPAADGAMPRRHDRRVDPRRQPACRRRSSCRTAR